MALTVSKATKDQLPQDTTDGFFLKDAGEIVMFFHWHKESEYTPEYSGELGEVLPSVKTPEDSVAKRTGYHDVLAALPDRLATLGYEDQSDKVLAQVIDKFGAG